KTTVSVPLKLIRIVRANREGSMDMTATRHLRWTAAYLILFAGAIAVCAAAEVIQWKSIGAGGGGNMVSAAVSPADPNIVLMGSDIGGIYRSGDGGATWQLRNGFLVQPTQFSAYGIYDGFVFDTLDL